MRIVKPALRSVEGLQFQSGQDVIVIGDRHQRRQPQPVLI
jgi:hypothetical protein